MYTVADLQQIFSACFRQQYNTELVIGNDEPIYLPAGISDIGIDAQDYAQVVLAHGFFNSALHEIAHWCLAGERRRQLVDFGYWYCPDGRSAEQQKAFQNVEIKPQAIEWAFSLACGRPFRPSCDNLNGDEFGNQPDVERFWQDIYCQAEVYLQQGFPSRAEVFIKALADHYGQPYPLQLQQFKQVGDAA